MRQRKSVVTWEARYNNCCATLPYVVAAGLSIKAVLLMHADAPLACLCAVACMVVPSHCRLRHCIVQVLVPTSQFIRSLVAARLAADVLDVPTVLIARTDAHSATLLTSDVYEVDRAFCTGERPPEGFYCVKAGVKVSCKLVP